MNDKLYQLRCEHENEKDSFVTGFESEETAEKEARLRTLTAKTQGYDLNYYVEEWEH